MNNINAKLILTAINDETVNKTVKQIQIHVKVFL